MYISYNLAGHAFIMINSSGENIIVIVGGANMHYDDLSQLPNEYKEAIDNGKDHIVFPIVTSAKLAYYSYKEKFQMKLMSWLPSMLEKKVLLTKLSWSKLVFRKNHYP